MHHHERLEDRTLEKALQLMVEDRGVHIGFCRMPPKHSLTIEAF